MTAKTSISPSAQATTVGPEASWPPSDSGSAQTPSIRRGMPKGPVVVDPEEVEAAGAPGGGGEASQDARGAAFGSVGSLMATDCTRSGLALSRPAAGRRRGRPGAAPRDLDLDARVQRSGGRGSAPLERPAPGGRAWLRRRAAAWLRRYSCACLEQVLLVQRREVGNECVHGGCVSNSGALGEEGRGPGQRAWSSPYRRPGVDAPRGAAMPSSDQDPDRQDDCDEGSHPAPPFLLP